MNNLQDSMPAILFVGINIIGIAMWMLLGFGLSGFWIAILLFAISLHFGKKSSLREWIRGKKRIGVGFGVFLLFLVSLVMSLGSDAPSQQVQQPNNPVASINKEDRCLDVSANFLLGIDTRLANGKAVRSNDFEKVYFVSAYLQGEDLSGTDIATFATNNVNGSAFVLAVDSYAKEFTVFPASDREGTQFYITLNDDGARESRDCVIGAY